MITCIRCARGMRVKAGKKEILILGYWGNESLCIVLLDVHYYLLFNIAWKESAKHSSDLRYILCSPGALFLPPLGRAFMHGLLLRRALGLQLLAMGAGRGVRADGVKGGRASGEQQDKLSHLCCIFRSSL